VRRRSVVSDKGTGRVIVWGGEHTEWEGPDNDCRAALFRSLDAAVDAAARHAVVADRADTCLAVLTQRWPYRTSPITLLFVVVRGAAGADALFRFFRAFVQQNRQWTSGIELNGATVIRDREGALSRRDVVRCFVVNCRPPGSE
jgi:hypothetical protein